MPQLTDVYLRLSGRQGSRNGSDRDRSRRRRVRCGLRATAEASFTVTSKSHSVGEYFADLLVEEVLVVELKSVERLSSELA